METRNPAGQHVRSLLLTGLLLTSLSAHSQVAKSESAEAENAKAPQLYQVELIVFRNLDQSRTTGEIPRMPEPEMAEMLEQDLARLSIANPGKFDAEPEVKAPRPAGSEMSKGADTYTGEETNEETPPLWIPVNDEGLLLAGTATAIDRLQAYELLSYIRWAQPAADVTIAKQLDLMELGANPAVVMGTVELHQRRYLHLVIDVTLATAHGNGASMGSPSSFQFFDAPEALPALRDSRRIRLERLHYFDQPQFGVLAMISRLDVPEEDNQEDLSVAVE